MKDNYEVPGKYVTIATNSTAGCKFWTREGWQEVINYLHTNGFKVINTSIEDNPFDNCEKIVDTSLEYTIDCIRQSEFFIGLSSGLSWVAWALDTPVVMISNFTEANHEFSCTRIQTLTCVTVVGMILSINLIRVTGTGVQYIKVLIDNLNVTNQSPDKML